MPERARVAQLLTQTWTIAALRERFVVRGEPLPRAVEKELASDSRAGARAVLTVVRERRRRARAEQRRLRKLLSYERARWDEGHALVAGLDEVGMGPMAGPVVASAVVLPPSARIVGIDDSKRLDASTRERLAVEIREVALGVGVGWVPSEEIDRVGLHAAGLLAMRRAMDDLGVTPTAALVDGQRPPELGVPVTTIVKGDRLSMSIAAASIVAKVLRDAHMVKMDGLLPGYGFARHKGYITAVHKRGLATLGPSRIHRRCFAIVREADALTGR